MDYHSLIRSDLKNIKPYLPERYLLSDESAVWIDANENPYQSKWGRYPDPRHKDLRNKIGIMKRISPKQVFISHGSDEAIDLIIRTFCMPGKDAISIVRPVFEMYAHAAKVSNVKVLSYSMEAPYQPGMELAEQILSHPSKVLFLCSPNNPTGNLMPQKFLHLILEKWRGMLVIDEAYIDFADQESCMSMISDHPNLIILQTFSKAFGLAALRLGMTFAQKWVIDTLEAIKMPYNVSESSIEIAIRLLDTRGYPHHEIAEQVSERKRMEVAISTNYFVQEIYPSDANFFLIKCADSRSLFEFLKSKGIYTRLRKDPECENCLRISVGTPKENDLCLSAFASYEHEQKNQDL